MCRAITCTTCQKTTWAGCGQHIDQVMQGVPRNQRCEGHVQVKSTGPTGQSQGDGKRILAEAERWAFSEWESTVMMMTVIGGRDSLLAFYERRGYQRTGVQKPFHVDTRFGVPKRDDLHLEVLEKVLQRG